MLPLIKTNRYLRHPQTRRRMITENVYDSSVFEGALGLPKPQPFGSRRHKMAHLKKRAHRYIVLDAVLLNGEKIFLSPFFAAAS